MSKLTVAFVRDIMNSHTREEISFSRMVELLNEELVKQNDPWYELRYDTGQYPSKEWEIWIGDHSLGQGYDSPTKPQLVDKIIAPRFNVACLLHELKSKLNYIENTIIRKGYVDEQTCRWWYNYDINSDDWTGKYFESEEEALTSFKRC